MLPMTTMELVEKCSLLPLKSERVVLVVADG